MADCPKLTIITPSFNQGEFIEETIRSVLEQGYPELEYVVIDGGSTDSTIDVLRRYDGHPQLTWLSEPDEGQADALNKGLRMATGDVIAFINSDDRYQPGALRAVGEYLAAHPKAAWLTGRCITIDSAGREIRRAITLYKDLWLRWPRYRLLKVLNFLSQPATFWRRDVVEAVGPFDAALRYAMDYDYHLRVWRRYPPHVTRRTLAAFRVHPRSKAGSSASAQFDVDLAIARRHTRSRLLLALHAAHNALAINTYRILLRD